MRSPVRPSSLSNPHLSHQRSGRFFFRHQTLLAALLVLGVMMGALAVGQSWSVSSAKRKAERASGVDGLRLAGAVVAPPPAGVITVNSTADTATAGDGQCTLREAITNANSDSDTTGGDCSAGSGADAISFSVTGTITLSSALPDITTDMTISGPGASQLTVSGNGGVRVFNVTATVTVTISGLTVSNGNAFSQNGGGIQNGSGTLSVTNCTFSSNSASPGSGGAIYNDSGTLSVNNCIFSNNSTQNRGGGIYNNTGTLNVTGSTFTGGISGSGGGIYNGNITTGAGTANVTNSTFSNNQSVFNPGGGIRNFGTLNVTNSTFSGNSTVVGGGGALSHSASGKVMTVTNCTISGNSANSGGGGIQNSFGTTKIRNSIVALNTSGSGPDILNSSGTVTSLGHNVVGNTTGSGLSAQAGDYFDSAVTPFYLGPLQNNGGSTQTMIPGGVAVDGGDDCVLNQSCSSDNLSFDLTTDQRGFQRKLGGHVDIGAVEVIPVNTLADHDDGTCDADCTLREAINVANSNPGSTIGFSVTSTITLLTALPDISTAMTITGPGADQLTVQRSTAAGTPDFGIFNVAAGVSDTVSISGLTISNGKAASDGGGIGNINSSTVNITNCEISGNTSGGGNVGNENTGTINVKNSAVINNSGGGIRNQGHGTINVINSTVSNNSTTNVGGGIAVIFGTVNVTNSTISNNHAVSGGFGGGIYNNAGTVHIGNSIVALNDDGGSSPNVGGTFITQGYNLIGANDGASTSFPAGNSNVNNDKVGTSAFPIDPLLGGLANNGGPTKTSLLLLGSPAINAGNNALAVDQNSNALTTDQRGTGFPRIVNTTVDMGADEVNYTIAATAGDGQTAQINTTFGTKLKVTVKESNVEQAGIDVTFTAPSTGASGTFQGAGNTKIVTTDSFGVAEAPDFTANGVGGSYSVVASLNTSGLLSTTFSLTNSIPTPTISADMNGTGTTTQACPEQPLTLHANTTGATSYQWYSNGTLISGATSQTYQATSAATYTVTASANDYTTSQSSGYVVQDPTPHKAFVTAGGPTTFCQGGNVTLTSDSATGIQWYKDGVAIPGASGQSYVATASGSYTAQLNALGCHSIFSDAVTVTVNPIPSTPTISAGGPTTFTAGGSVTLTSSSATGNQWYLNGSPIAGATNQTYDATASGDYTVVVTTNGCSSATSAATTMTVVPAATLGNYPNTSVALGANTTVTPDAAPTNATSVSVSTSTSFKGMLTVNPTTGVVRVTNASVPGVYTVTVMTFNSLGVPTAKTFTLTVQAGTACAAVSVFTNKPDSIVGAGPRSVAVGDFNNDGKQDIAVANSASTTVSIRLGDGAGNFSGATDVGVGSTPRSVAIGDFDNDGKQDLAVANFGSTTVSIRLGDGAGGFSGMTEVSVGDHPLSVAVGDFNNDGKQDLAVANNSSNTVSIRLGDGAGGFSGSTDVSIGSGSTSVKVGDFNGDGKQDLAIANANLHTVLIRLGDGAGGFSGSTEVDVVSAGSPSVAIGDFNNDGIQDLAAANFSQASVSIRLGDGAGNFSGTTDVSVGSGPVSVAVGDFNNDGLQDIASAGFNSNTVSIRLGNGAGGFSDATDSSGDFFPGAVAVGDFNGDGIQDLTVANFQFGTVSIRLGDCDLPPTITAATGLSRQQGSPASNSQIATVADDDGNGNVTVKVNNSTSATVNGVTVSNIRNIAGTILADIIADCGASNASFTLQASDGISTATDTLNITVAANTVPVLTYGNQTVAFNGSLNVTPTTATDNGSIGYSVQSVSPALTTAPTVNASGVVSIAGAQPAGAHTITIRATDNCGLTTDAPFTLTVQQPPTPGNYPNTTVALSGETTITPDSAPTNTTGINVSTSTDFKGTLTADPTTGVVRVTDAHPAGTYMVTVRAFNSVGASTTRTFTLTVQAGTACAGASFFTNAADVSVGTNPESVAIGDFNNDGKQDIATANSGVSSTTVSIRLGNGTGSFSGTTTVSVGTNPRAVVVGDFNNDGKQDIAAANYGSNTVSIRLGDGLGGFSGSTEVSVGVTPQSVAIGDFNGDGKQDIATANFGSANVSIRLGDGLGGFSGTTTVSVGTQPRSVVVGDFNGDGKQDIATANQGSNNVSIRLGDGLGGFSGTTEVLVGSQPSSVAVGDFNGDGKQDLAVTNRSLHTVSIRLGDGLGGFSGTTEVGVGFVPLSVAIGDFNNDGKQDFATANNSTPTASFYVSIRLGDGLGGFSGTTEVLVGDAPTSVAIGDFNGDGRQDIATVNQGSNNVSIRLGGCNPAPAITAATGLSRQQGSPATNSQIATVTDDGGNGNVFVSFNGLSSMTVNGVTISNIVNTNGTITADIVADCTASNATFTLRADDGTSAVTTPLNITVTANTAPVLTYTNPPAVAFNGSLSVAPTAAADNVAITGYSVQSVVPALTTAPTVNASGVVSITSAQPAGAHTITIRATDNCGVSTDASFTLNVSKADQTITFGALTDKTFGDPDFNVSATASSGLTVSFAASGQCTVTGTTVHITGAGSCTITASQAGDNNYNAATPVDRSFTIGKASATITLSNLSQTYDGTPKAPTVVTTPSGLSYTLTYSQNGQAVTSPTNVGNYNVTATITDPNYQGSTTTGILVINKATPVITWNNPANIVYGTPLSSTQLNATANTPGTFTYNPPAGTVLSVGTHQLSVTFTPTNTANYTSAQASVTLTVDPVTAAALNFDNATYSVNEGDGRVTITVNRTGGAPGVATVTYATSDTAGLQNCDVFNGIASSRCDYPTSVGILRFASGETSKTISIPIVDDSYAEGPENFSITLSNPVGENLGTVSTATITITDNETVTGANPLSSNFFFVRQHYIDFLGREPEPKGLADWLAILNNCQSGDKSCDRIEVSSDFFRSSEFQERGYFVYRFYSASLGRKPDYAEFMPDMAKVSGFLTEAEKEANKVAFINEFMARTEFKNRYDSQVTPTAYVDALLQAAGLPNHPSRAGWIAGLQNGTLTRAQVLRQLAESAEVYRKFYNQAFVVEEYFGYLRRDPDAMYLQWIDTLNQTGDYRTMINGFMNSTEYRQRFGP
jgi:CSLREA domain-containing protein